MLINYIKYLLSCEQIPSHNSEALGEYVTVSSHGLAFHSLLRIPTSQSHGPHQGQL